MVLTSSKIGILFVLLQIGIICVVGQTFNPRIFSAEFRISNDPNVKGILNGVTHYNADLRKLRNDYVIGAVEVFNFTGSGIRYLGCDANTVCDAETFRDPMPIYYKESSDSSTTQITGIDGRTCLGWNKLNPKARQVKSVWIDSNNKLCRAEYVHPTNPSLLGRRIEFLNVRSLDNGVNLDIYKSWPCPAQQCVKQMDVILAFDESGSIGDADFRREKDFAIGFAKGFKFGPTGVAMELVMFADTARRIMPLTIDQNSAINFINGVTQSKQATCIGCGIDMARTDFTTYGRSGVAKVLVVLTDGKNNRQTGTFTTVVEAAKNAGITLFAIGVGDYDKNELYYIGSNVTGVQTVFESTNFETLTNILNSFIVSTCIDIPGNPCGTGCLGFCACRSKCICPDMCNDGNACTNDVCINGTNGNGCISSPKTCNDNNKCTLDGCNIVTGCTFSNISCSDGNSCTNEVCVPSIGCQYSAKDCNDRNPCTADTCSPSLPNGCNNTAIDCNRCFFPVNVTCPPIPCKINDCDPFNGTCRQTDVVCEDNNMCSNDFCNTTTNRCEFKAISCDDGNYCTHDNCNSTTGCTNIPFGATECDDYNVCTQDYCSNSTGCVHVPIACDDYNNCTIDTCNSLTGCTYTLRDCALELPLSSTCRAVDCNIVTGCFIMAVESLIQKCGKCVDEGPCPDIVAIASISAGALAGIVIAGVAVFAAFGAASGRAGYIAYMKNKNNMQGAQMSPLYQDNGLSGRNPFFQDPSASITNA